MSSGAFSSCSVTLHLLLRRASALLSSPPGAPARHHMRLVKSCGAERVEAACGRALEIGARSYSSVKSILKTLLSG